MKNFNSVDETPDKTTPVTDFLDSLDTDISSPISETVNEENIDTEVDTVNLNDNNDEQTQEITALVVTKPNSLFVAQTMFKKSIKISIKSFLISLSLGFLNLFL